jgi:hypothetical protein
VQGDAAAAGAVCVDQRRNLAVDPRLRQPPQTPKWGQNGAIRSGLLLSIATSLRRSG